MVVVEDVAVRAAGRGVVPLGVAMVVEASLKAVHNFLLLLLLLQSL